MFSHCLHIVDVLYDGVPGQIESQVDQILHICVAFVLGSGIELGQLCHIKTIQPFGKVIQLIQIYKSVFQYF